MAGDSDEKVGWARLVTAVNSTEISVMSKQPLRWESGEGESVSDDSNNFFFSKQTNAFNKK